MVKRMTGSVEAATSGAEPDFAIDYSKWHVWRGRTEGGAPCAWYASRIDAPLSARAGRHGLFMTVSGDTEEQLRDQLRVQAEREAKLR